MVSGNFWVVSGSFSWFQLVSGGFRSFLVLVSTKKSFRSSGRIFHASLGKKMRIHFFNVNLVLINLFTAPSAFTRYF